MREIKFRAWDKRQEIMIPNDQIMRLEFGKNGVDWLGCWIVVADSQGDPEQGLHQVNKEDLELMQYTGLKDKNGKEIWEGDIVKWSDEDNVDYISQIIWCGEYLAFDLVALDGKSYDWEYNILSSEQNIEVIGNIYENPNLLK